MVIETKPEGPKLYNDKGTEVYRNLSIIILGATFEDPEDFNNTAGKIQVLFQYARYTGYCGCNAFSEPAIAPIYQKYSTR